MGALQPMHLLIVLAIVLLIFGPGKLPELGRAVGDGMRELKRATNGEADAHSSKLQPQAFAISTAACPSCAASLPANARFCGGCGSQITMAVREPALL
jgi:sec-independent protein translocase protein TatA